MIGIDNTSQNELPNITFKNVSFSWPEKKEHVINNCSFSINKTGLWMIVGKNGSGKSTLLKLINGLLKPTNGVINCLKRNRDVLNLQLLKTFHISEQK